MMNPWETCALEYRFTEKDKKQDVQPAQPTTTTTTTTTKTTGTPGTTDTLFYPGLYCPSGLDVMTVLLRIFARPNPEIDLGPVDSSVALVVCDLAAPDTPIVYVSDPFLELTGYRADEVVGRNCRFLQAPGGRVKPHSARKHVPTQQ
ncbi:White collar 1 protein [Cytospora mali]|uniref:White collar 1 protein n=1 Tax=Cytospora mali TaxID=578113 RepID=A0A194UMW5_CYTMA|nr:White collar 1 protein [Valsa mali var. pyri (nom. inval.)]